MSLPGETQQQRIARLQELRRSGMSAQEVAASEGISHQRVSQLTGPMPKQGRQLDSQRRAFLILVVTDYETGLTRSAVAAKHGVTKTDVDGALSLARRHGLGFDPARRAEARWSSGSCVNGHPRSPENTMGRSDGRRQCRACFNGAQARYRAGKGRQQ